jgi:hypothetical protein
MTTDENSNEDAAIAGATRPLTLHGHTLTMRRLSDMDLSELDEWVRVRAFDLARRCASGLPASERQEILGAAIRTAAGLSFLSLEGAQMMSTLDGVARLLWQSVKADHPKETIESVRRLLVDENDLKDVMTQWRDMNRRYEPKKPSPEGANSQSDNSTGPSPESTGGPSSR